MKPLHMKGYVIQVIAGDGAAWDYDVALRVIAEYGLKNNKRNMGMIRLWLIEYAANGLIRAVAEAVDDGTYFGKDKLLCRYVLSAFGKQRMRDAALALEEV